MTDTDFNHQAKKLEWTILLLTIGCFLLLIFLGFLFYEEGTERKEWAEKSANEFRELTEMHTEEIERLTSKLKLEEANWKAVVEENLLLKEELAASMLGLVERELRFPYDAAAKADELIPILRQAAAFGADEKRLANVVSLFKQALQDAGNKEALDNFPK